MSKSKRIVAFVPGLTEGGGAARRTTLVLSTLAERGWDVRAVARCSRRARFRRFEVGRLQALEVPGFGRTWLGGGLFLLVAIPLGIFWGVRAQGFIAVQLTSQTTAAAVVSAITRRPFMAFLTTGGDVSEIHYIQSRRSAPFRRRLLGRASFVVGQTVEAASALRDLVPPERTVVMGNPVKPVYPPASLNSQPSVCFTGRFSQEKGLFTLLGAWKPIARQNPEARLILVGSGGEFRSIERELSAAIGGSEELANSVRITGWVSDVGSYLRASDVFVLPSTSEGMSNALLEACAYGRIVVASAIPGNTAVLGSDYPLLFSPGDEAALTACLERALGDREIRQEAARRVGEIAMRHDPQRFASELERLIDSTQDGTR